MKEQPAICFFNEDAASVAVPAEPLKFRLGHRPALDGLRGIAVLLVMLFHIGLPIRGGFLGVDIFFVLSGFLITALLVQEFNESGTISLKRFYARRALRLLPLLFLVLLLRCGCAVLLASPQERVTALRYSLVVLGYAANWARILQWVSIDGPLGHCWSLSVEEQFYLLWPPILMVLLRCRLPRNRVGLLILGGIVASAVLRAILCRCHFSWVRMYLGLDTRADALLAGCLVGLLAASDLLPQSGRLLLLLRCAAGAGLVVIGWMCATSKLTDKYLYTWKFSLVAVAVAILIATLLMSPPRWVVRILESPLLAWPGRISYGLYLWHIPVLVLVASYLPPRPNYGLSPEAQLLIMVLSFAAALLSYYLVEKPFLRLKTASRGH
jgi:peptidoglycan/LPS O-acetylase OafA/YrhL